MPTASRPPKLLLTSVCRPFGGSGEGDSVGAELFHAQVTRAQGPFSLRQTVRVWGLDYIAHNLHAHSVVLHYPTLKELTQELSSGEFTHVGINFVVATFHKLREMVAVIRRHAPSAQIVLGGYGTVLPDELLKPHSDHICRDEGIAFMRRLLGEPEDRAIAHPHAPIPVVSVLGFQREAVVGHVTAGLGCTNACDFCCTSHFFDTKYRPFAGSGREIYEALLGTAERAAADGVEMTSHIIIDEDFFMHPRRAREFLGCVREGGVDLSLMGFGSVRGLSKFTGREIAEMGFDLIWNAFEGAKSGYKKQQGRPLRELYADLRSVGCSTLTSMIIGFPYQDEATMRAEFDELMQLEPAMMQCLIYFAFPGTPFHAQVLKEKRYLPTYQKTPDLRRWDGFAMHFEHPLIDDPLVVERLQKELYRQDFMRLGPSLLRLAENWLAGHLNLRHDESPLLVARSARLGRDLRGMLPAISPMIAFAPSKSVRERAIRLRRGIIDATGAPSLEEQAMSLASPALHLLTRGARRLGLSQQPGLLRLEYNGGQAAKDQHSARVIRLQGGLSAGITTSLVDDARTALGRIARRLSDPHAGAVRERAAIVTNAPGPRSAVVEAPAPGRANRSARARA